MQRGPGQSQPRQEGRNAGVWKSLAGWSLESRKRWGCKDWDHSYIREMTVKMPVLPFTPFSPILWQTLTLESKWTIWFWSCPQNTSCTISQTWSCSVSENCAEKEEDTVLAANPRSWHLASTYAQHFLEAERATAQPLVPETVIKETHEHPTGSWEHKPKITGFRLNWGVSMKHEKEMIL